MFLLRSQGSNMHQLLLQVVFCGRYFVVFKHCLVSLEITFNTGAKFKSFLRFPKEFQVE